MNGAPTGMTRPTTLFHLTEIRKAPERVSTCLARRLLAASHQSHADGGKIQHPARVQICRLRFSRRRQLNHPPGLILAVFTAIESAFSWRTFRSRRLDGHGMACPVADPSPTRFESRRDPEAVGSTRHLRERWVRGWHPSSRACRAIRLASRSRQHRGSSPRTAAPNSSQAMWRCRARAKRQKCRQS